MSEPEHFLTRWSRLKRQGGETAEQEQPRVSEEAQPAQNESGALPPKPDEAAQSAAQTDASPPAFDLTTLPPIESITAATDIRPFLAPGVPAALTRAALRRAWLADPKIRDFIEIAENQWDFATPDSVPGFSTFKPGDDVSRFVAQLVSKPEEALEEPAESPAGGKIAALSTPHSVEKADGPDAPQRDLSAAVQTEADAVILHRSEDDVAAPKEAGEVKLAALPTRRGRGRALPQ